jgi:peroxiredoxin
MASHFHRPDFGENEGIDLIENPIRAFIGKTVIAASQNSNPFSIGHNSDIFVRWNQSCLPFSFL